MNEEEFYIGYLPKIPKVFLRAIRAFVILAFITGMALIALLWTGQKPFAKSFFEFGNIKDFEGTVQAKPIPFLLVERPEKKNGLPEFIRYPLVGEGKHGVGDELTKLDGQRVKLKGTLIYRDDLQMIELVSGSVETKNERGHFDKEESVNLGNFTLKGEIIDSKCYLGVMNPGQSKPHRECAVRCISGGVPPIFVVKDSEGNSSELWLLSTNDGPVNKDVLDYVAEPVEINGIVARTGDQLFFKINAKNIRRID